MSRLSAVKRGVESLPPRIILYGTEGVGKTTFASGAPNPVLIQTEDGAGQLDVARLPVRTEFSEVIADLDSLISEEHDFQTVVIDSLDWLERLIWKSICEEEGAKSIEFAAGGYGKGYHLALRSWQDIASMLDYLRARGIIIILLAHSKIERIEDPENPAYDRYSPRLHKLAASYLCEWSDAVLFAQKKMRIAQSKEKSGTRAIAHGVNDERILRVSGGPACLAKNRYGLSGELPLSWDSLFNAMGGN